MVNDSDEGILENNKLSLLSQLPQGWIWTTVADISERIQYGYTASATLEPIGPKMLRITDIQDNNVDWTSVPYCQIDDTQKQKYFLRKGDLVFARTGATVGKSFLIRTDIPEAVFASYLIRIILSKHVKNEFVYYFFQSNRYWTQIRQGQVGTGQPSVNSKILSKIAIPLPPLAEQNRIVETIETLFSENEIARVALNKVSTLLRSFRQSVLAKAFQGELTQRDSKDQPPQELLERIQQDRQNRREHKRNGRKLTTEDSLDLPTEWTWTQLGQICHIGKHHVDPSKKPRENYNYLSIENIESESGNLVNFKPTLGKDIHSVKIAFTTEDVLYSKLRPYLNKVHIPSFFGVSATDLIPLRPEGGIPREYIAYYLRTRRVVEYANQNTRGIQLPRLQVNELLSLPIPLASLEEMNRVVSRIETLLDFAENIKTVVEAAKERNSKINEAILSKAFNGELVPQNPNDEPASQQLLRIQDSYYDSVALSATKILKKGPTVGSISRKRNRHFESIFSILQETGETAIEKVFSLSGLTLSDFWDKLRAEIDSGHVERIQIGERVLLRALK
jgi:type I restriction enzyme S subunit